MKKLLLLLLLPISAIAGPETCTGNATNAWFACYYKGKNFETQVATRTEPRIDFDWGNGGPVETGADNFSVVWRNNVTYPAGDWKFTAITDDGVRLYIDNQLVMEDWTDHGAYPLEKTITLTAGEHALRVEYYEAQGGASAKLFSTSIQNAPMAFQACRPSDTDIVTGRWKLLPVDSTVSSYYTRLAVWIDRCDGKVTAQFGTFEEVAQVLAMQFKSDAELKAWTEAQPVRPYTPSEIEFMNSTVASYSPRAGVKPLTSTAIDAPVYVLNADGSRSTLSVPGKRAPRGTPCDMTKRISTTSYYLVPSISGGQYYATCAIVSAL